MFTSDKRMWGKFSCLAIVALQVGCSVPVHQRVSDGIQPEHVDTNVRFRTTYYFRVFDFCPPTKPHYAKDSTGIRGGASQNRAPADPVLSPGDSKLLILTDSLYRFRMTGKANALTNRIHFESGTLRASEIDPFGANIEFDQENNRFFHVSARETKRRAIESMELKRVRDAKRDIEPELRELIKERGKLEDATGIAGGARKDSLDKLIQKKTATLEALVDREHVLLLAQSPLEVVPKPSVPDAVFAVTRLDQSAQAMAKLLDESSEARKELNQPLALGELPESGSATAFGREVRIALENLLRAAEDKTEQMKQAQQELEEKRDTEKKRVTDANEKLEEDEGFKQARNAAAKGRALLAKARGLTAELARISVSNAALSARAPAASPGRASGSDAPEQIICGDGNPARRGFQIMGPEGWRTFDQDERLVMAMSSSAKPLIGVIKELASRINAQQLSESERRLPFAIEHLRTLETEKKIKDARAEEPEDAEDLLQAAIDRFNKEPVR